MSDIILKLDHVGVRFDALKAVDDVSLCINCGERRAIIGPNGAGKTTLFNAITGVVRPTSGRVDFDGRDNHAIATTSPRRLWHQPYVSDHKSISEPDCTAKHGDRSPRGLKARKFSFFGTSEFKGDEYVQAERALGLSRLGSRRRAPW